jgi:hypothetical protein
MSSAVSIARDSSTSKPEAAVDAREAAANTPELRKPPRRDPRDTRENSDLTSVGRENRWRWRIIGMGADLVQ